MSPMMFLVVTMLSFLDAEPPKRRCGIATALIHIRGKTSYGVTRVLLGISFTWHMHCIFTFEEICKKKIRKNCGRLMVFFSTAFYGQCLVATTCTNSIPWSIFIYFQFLLFCSWESTLIEAGCLGREIMARFVLACLNDDKKSIDDINIEEFFSRFLDFASQTSPNFKFCFEILTFYEAIKIFDLGVKRNNSEYYQCGLGETSELKSG